MVKLSADQIAGLDAGSAIPMGTPHEQINGSAPRIAGSKPKVLELPSIPVGQIQSQEPNITWRNIT